MPFPGDPRLRRARPRHGFTPSAGYVENLQPQKTQKVNWEKMRNKYIPWTLMNILGHQLGGYKYGMGALMTFPGLLQGK